MLEFKLYFRVPHPSVGQHTEDERNIIRISDDGIVFSTDYRAERYQFWTKLIEKYYNILSTSE